LRRVLLRGALVNWSGTWLRCHDGRNDACVAAKFGRLLRTSRADRACLASLLWLRESLFPYGLRARRYS
jgi:hypothetical protein